MSRVGLTVERRDEVVDRAAQGVDVAPIRCHTRPCRPVGTVQNEI